MLEERLKIRDNGRGDDTDLVRRAKAGDRDAMGELFLGHVQAVRRLLVSVIGPGAELDDLTQDVFIQVHKSLRRFRGDAGFSTWLHRLTVNVAISHLRKKKNARMEVNFNRVGREAGVSMTTPHDVSATRQMLTRLYAILETVSPSRRAAFVLFEIEGYSLAELAGTLGISRPAAKSRVWFARREVMKKAASDEVLRPLVEEMRRK